MKKYILNTALFTMLVSTSIAQVGIGTNNPTTTLDIDGTLRIRELPVEIVEDISLTGLTSGNILNRTDNGGNVLTVNNQITTAPVTRGIGYLNLGLEPTDGSSGGVRQIYNLDLNIVAEAANDNSTFINVHSYTSKYDIAGIANGTEGRHVTLFFTETNNIKLKQDDSNALAQNRIITLAVAGISTSGQGFMELVYDADAGSDGLGRWLVIKFRS